MLSYRRLAEEQPTGALDAPTLDGTQPGPIDAPTLEGRGIPEQPEHRSPVAVPSAEFGGGQHLSHEWHALTGQIQRGIQTNPAVRETIAALASEPLDQHLALNALQLASKADDHVQSLMSRYDKQIVSYLNQPDVPEEFARVDLQHAHLTQSINNAELLLIVNRYVYARDIKLLSLMASIKQEKAGLQFDEHGETTLENGIHIVVNTDNAAENAELTYPELWQNRRQLKDRVWEATINGRPHIIKERKTDRHTDTRKYGHIDGLTSAQEFATAKMLHDHATIDHGPAQVSFEEPEAYVEFPDGPDGYPGFQFLITRYEPDLIVEDDDKESDTPPGTVLTRLHEALEAAGDHAPGKAEDLMARTQQLYQEALEAHNLRSIDTNPNVGYRIHTHPDEGVQLELVAFDFEYMYPKD
jgi:hypothetical protein